MNRILPLIQYLLRHHLGTKQVLETGVTESGHAYKVVRRKYALRIFPTELNIETPKGVYSSIWESNQRRGPYYPHIQRHILKHVALRSEGNMLILGGAGCAIPRCLVANYPKAQVTVVEYSQQLIGVAQRWFLNGTDTARLHIVCDDAFAYVQQENRLFELVFIDLFDVNTLVNGLFEPSFYEQIERILAPQGKVYINIFGISRPQLVKLRKILQTRFAVHHLHHPDYNYLYLHHPQK